MNRVKIIGVAAATLAVMLLGAQPAAAAPAQGAAATPAATRAAWDCAAGYSCYYDGTYGRNKLFTAARCGEHDFRGGPYQDKISSIANYGSGRVDVWKWHGGDLWEWKGYVDPGREGNFPDDDVSIDLINIWC